MPDCAAKRRRSDWFIGPPELPAECRHNYRCHLTFALLDAAAAGVLSNAGIMALRGLGAEQWQLGLRIAFSSIGMFATLPLGYWMARRRKLPFVVAPGVAFGACSILAAGMREPLAFLIVLGLGAIFEVALRPAVTAVIRGAYPATHRGTATGAIRKWSSLVFLMSIMSSASLLAQWSAHPQDVIAAEMVAAGLLSLVSFGVFRQIRIDESQWNEDPDVIPPHVLRETVQIVRRDRRFRRYLASSFLFGFFGLLYAPYIAAFLVQDLSLDYLPASLFLHVIPAAAAFLVTESLGRRIDRTNPWNSWMWIRLGWGLDPLLLILGAVSAGAGPLAAVGLTFAGRLARGAAMGGSYILWWQIGVTHFAAPGVDTSRYMGIFTFLNGVMRLGAPLLGGWLILRLGVTGLFAVGGCGVLLSALHAAWETRQERHRKELATIADFEAACGPETKNGRRCGDSETPAGWNNER